MVIPVSLTSAATWQAAPYCSELLIIPRPPPAQAGRSVSVSRGMESTVALLRSADRCTIISLSALAPVPQSPPRLQSWSR